MSQFDADKEGTISKDEFELYIAAQVVRQFVT